MEEAQASTTVRWRFVATILLGSFLLFLVQPMVARLALPRLGGAPAVWNSAMLVYQALLLGGYAYAHWLSRLSPRRQPMVHLALFVLAGLTLPIGLSAAMPSAQANPFLWVPWLLLTSIGPLFFVVSAQAPLIQRWYALSGGGDPYPLYAASNFGSFAGLLAYPLLVEPLMPVGEQRWLWSAGYAVLALLVLWCALAVPRTMVREEREVEADAGPAPAWRERLYWVMVAAVPSGLILSTTLHLTTDIGAMPLLWVLPLGLYLLSFTVAFSTRRGPAELVARLAPFLMLAAACGLFVNSKGMAVLFGIVALLTLFAVSVALHAQLFDRRPNPRYLTLFYLMLSVGGVIGGLFGALIAPLVFNWTYEHLILLLAAALLIAVRSPFEDLFDLWNGSARARRVTIAGLFLVIVLALLPEGVFGIARSSALATVAVVALLAIGIAAIGNRVLFAGAIAGLMLTVGAWDRLRLSMLDGTMTRSFFGIYTVRPKDEHARWLIHGTTVHGVQNLGSPEREEMATSYYVPQSGVGRAMETAPGLFGPDARIGVVGLGAGTLACYARPGQRWTYYEIDPAVARIARDPDRFTFLSRCTPGAPVVLGDARLRLAEVPNRSFDLLVVDAFSSDAVPLHLLTREAFAVYRRALAPDGLLLVHVSNRFFRLAPAVATVAELGGWQARQLVFKPDARQLADNAVGSTWIALSPDPRTMAALSARTPDQWQSLPAHRGVKAWTDDHASILPLIRWN